MTDVARWAKVAGNEPPISWLDRSELIAQFIRANDIVCDLGAGAKTLKRFLPDSVRYFPVDCVQKTPDTWLADFNADFTLPNQAFTVITCIGVTDHLADRTKFLSRLAQIARGTFIIITDERQSAPDLGKFIDRLSKRSMFRGHSVYTGVLGMNGTKDDTKRPITDVICSNTFALQYATARLGLALRRLQRGGNRGPYWNTGRLPERSPS